MSKLNEPFNAFPRLVHVNESAEYKNSTSLTLMLSLARALILTCPLRADPEEGDRPFTVGGVVSLRGLTESDSVPILLSFPCVSTAVTLYLYELSGDTFESIYSRMLVLALYWYAPPLSLLYTL